MKNTQPRAKTTHDGLSGISARMPHDDLVRFKAVMKDLKSKYGAGFSTTDLILSIASMDKESLYKEVTRYKSTQSVNSAFVKKLDVSDDAKARIEAILAEEAQKRG